MRQLPQQLGFEDMEVEPSNKAVVIGLVICGVEFFDRRENGMSQVHDDLLSALKLEGDGNA